MSTDMQCYSIENQSAAIALYAAARSLHIVRSYVDAGRSGLRIEKRSALRSLLDDVTLRRAEFDVVLVYDVSRWGRFQDVDESAHYEFVCRKAGVSIVYCAEQFENDGSLIAAIAKNLKRVMAGEFSRELSVKVHAAQSRLAARGHRFGASGYGLRRMLVDQHGNNIRLLSRGECKSVRSEYSILVPGPEHEVETVRRIYQEFIEEKRSAKEIAERLNARGVLNSVGKHWTTCTIGLLLRNEKYAGTNIYNRTSKKLGGKHRFNPPREWIRKVDAFEAIISPARFAQAQRRRQDLIYRFSDNQLLDILTAIWCKRGSLSRVVIDGESMPSTHTYKSHFGSLTDAFRRIGFSTGRLVNRSNLRTIRNELCEAISVEVTKRGGSVRRPTGYNCQLLINEEVKVLVVIGRASTSDAARRQGQWRFGYRCKSKPDILVVARVEREVSSVLDFYLLPFLFFPEGSWLTVSGVNYDRLAPFRCTTLEPLFDLCARKPLDTRTAWPTSEN